MIAELKPYSEYKDSGLPWAGRVPSHWSFRRTKVLFGERVQKGFPNEPLLAATQSKGVVKKTDYGERTVTASKDFHLLKLVEPGDFVISLRSFQGGLEIAHCRGIISPAYTVLKPRIEARRAYFKQFFKSPDFIDSMTLFVTGIREGQNIDYERLSRAYLPVPPADEQESIGRFLDHCNGRLEKAIRSKRRVIALLQEQKQAIIHRAVTRGLDPNVKLKDSGIPWLGEIPAHWEVAKFKHFFRAQMGQTFLKPDLSDAGELPVLSATMSGAILGYTTKAKARTILKVGDLVIPARGNSIGYVALVSQTCTSSQTTIQALRIQNNRLITRFAHLFSIGNKPFLYSFVQTAIPQITTREVANNPLIVPPVSEQEEICDAVEKECSGLNTGITRYEREITLLREYRTRLTADVVTGKLDVRAAAAQLPDPDQAPAEADELEEETEEEEVEG